MAYPPIISKASESDFQIAPAGSHTARCVDVVALGLVETQFGAKEKVEIWWVINENMDNGEPFLVRQRYNNSIHEMSTMGQHLASWRGKPFTPSEQAGFQIENVIGHGCMLNIVHREHGGKTYANVAGVMPLPKGVPAPPAPADYKRQIDRNPSRDVRSHYYAENGNAPAKNGAPAGNDPAGTNFMPDDDLPF